MKNDIDKINMFAPKKDKNKWDRLHKKMESYLSELNPIEEEILKLMNKKIPIFDKIENLRSEMVETCIHKKEFLIEIEKNVIQCKFCNKKFLLKNDR